LDNVRPFSASVPPETRKNRSNVPLVSRVMTARLPSTAIECPPSDKIAGNPVAPRLVSVTLLMLYVQFAASWITSSWSLVFADVMAATIAEASPTPAVHEDENVAARADLAAKRHWA
jgi:hypothetical protein